MELIASFLPLIIVFGVFWFLFIRPQRQKQEEYEDMLSNLQRGDKVYTRGGIKALITEVKNDKLEVRIAPQVNVEIKRNGVAELIEKANKKAKDSEESQESTAEEVEGEKE